MIANPVLYLLAGAILVGLGVRLLVESAEARSVRRAAARLHAKGQAEDQWGASGVRVLEHTRAVLSTLKLLRLGTLLLLIPGATVLAWRLANPPAGDSAPSLAVEVLLPVAVATALFLAFYAMAAFGARGASQAKLAGPMPYRSGGTSEIGRLAWDLALSGFEKAFAFMRLERPEAQLYLVEDELRLAIGEAEMAALAQVPSREAEGRARTSERSENDMIRAIQRLDTTLVREIMVPINHVTSIRLADYTPERLLNLARRTGFTRFPCFHDRMTNLTGYINVHDLLGATELPKDLRSVVNRALYVPEIARVDSVLQELLRAKQQVAIVFDEFGGCCGWLSREDILEEVVGEIEDEYDRPARKLELQEGTYLVNAEVDLDDLAEMVGLKLEKRHCDTLAGYVYSRLGRVPRRGERLEDSGWQIEVAQMDSHRIRRIRLVPPKDHQVHAEQ